MARYISFIYSALLLGLVFILGVQAQRIGLIEYLSDPYEYIYIYELLKTHLYLSFTSMAIATFSGIVIGVVFSKKPLKRAAPYVMYIVGLGQSIPPIAVLALCMGFIGIGEGAAIFALSIYSMLPIARNTLTGILSTPHGVIDAARGLGLSGREILLRIELPYAASMMITGFRIALVLNISTAALGSLIGAGGLGELIFTGIEMMDTKLIIAGAIPVTVLALLLDKICEGVAKKVVPQGLQIEKGES